MSLRQMRRIRGDDGIPAPGEGEDFEPAYAKNSTKSLYAGLEISSNSDNEFVESDKDVPETPKVNNEKIKKKKNGKKKKERKNNQNNNEISQVQELDEIDRSILEINALLGEPEEPPKVIPQVDPKKNVQKLFTVRQMFFDPEAELRRRFGPDEDEDVKKRGRQPNLRIAIQKGYIIKTDKVYKKSGLSMDIVSRQDDLIFFAFKHNREYQQLHRSFILSQEEESGAILEQSQNKMHVEGLLEVADRLYYMERYSVGNKYIEEIIAYMQRCAHPFFSVTDIRVRLLYRHVENRAFHIAVFKYMHMLTNKACHRTALEFAKLLLNLDPSDPLAVLFIIDTLAIRAGEHAWLIKAIEYWSEERDAGYLFNMMYSLSLSEYHVAKKERVGYEKADQLLTKAMLQFPSVLVEMMKIAGIKNEKITSCPLFKTESTSGNLQSLIHLYARFTWHKFLVHSVIKWVIRNATTLVDEYESSPSVQAKAKELSLRRMSLFQTFPPEILRHLSLITPLSSLIVEGTVPEIANLSSYDPEPPKNGINRYERQANDAEGSTGVFEFFSSMLPDHEVMDAGMEYV